MRTRHKAIFSGFTLVGLVGLVAKSTAPQTQGQLITFQANTVAKAAEINQNFSFVHGTTVDLDARVQELESRTGDIDPTSVWSWYGSYPQPRDNSCRSSSMRMATG